MSEMDRGTGKMSNKVALCKFCNTMKWPSHQANCPERDTGEKPADFEQALRKALKPFIDQMGDARINNLWYLSGGNPISQILSAHAKAVAEAERAARLEELHYFDEIFTEYDSKRQVYEVIISHIRNRKARIAALRLGEIEKGGQ